MEDGELPAEIVRVESEHSALTVCIAAASVGARVFTATSANGLAYMNEQIWWAAGARLPLVMCCANRAMAAPWNVLNDQQDSMSVRDAGWIQLYCRDNQEILDTTLQAYRLAESLHLPVLVCYDGFLLSHTVMPVEIPSEAAVDEFLPRVPPLQILDPADPAQRRAGHPARPASRLPGRALPRLHGAACAAPPGPDLGARVHPGGGPSSSRGSSAAAGAGSSGVTSSTTPRWCWWRPGAWAWSWGWWPRTCGARGSGPACSGLRAYRPFPREAIRAALAGRQVCLVFDKAVSYGHEGPICSDVRGALAGVAGAPPVFGAIAGLGGRDVTTAQLADTARRAVGDVRAGVRDRPEEWVNLRL